MCMRLHELNTDQGTDNRERGNVITPWRINHFNGSVTEITARQWHSLLINLLLFRLPVPFSTSRGLARPWPPVGTRWPVCPRAEQSSQVSAAVGHKQVRDQPVPKDSCGPLAHAGQHPRWFR